MNLGFSPLIVSLNWGSNVDPSVKDEWLEVAKSGHDLETEQGIPSYSSDRQDDAVGGSFTLTVMETPKCAVQAFPIQSSRICHGKALHYIP